MKGIDTLSWPLARLPEAVERLGRRSGFVSESAALPEMPAGATDMAEVERRVQAVCDWLEIEAEPIHSPYPDVDDVVRNAGASLLMLPLQPVRF